MDLKDFDPATVTDVTAELGEANPCNRLYRLPGGQVVKVKSFEQTEARALGSPDNWRVFAITASLCDAAGQALPGTIGDTRKVTTRLTPSSPSHGEQLDEERRKWAQWCEQLHTRHGEDVAGVLPMAPPPAA